MRAFVKFVLNLLRIRFCYSWALMVYNHIWCSGDRLGVPYIIKQFN